MLKIASKVFDLNYAQAHKQFAILIDQPVRFAYIEELGSKQIDGQLLKDTVDGEMNVNIMFSTADVCKSQAKINIAGNGILTIKLDKGVKCKKNTKDYQRKKNDIFAVVKAIAIYSRWKNIQQNTKKTYKKVRKSFF